MKYNRIQKIQDWRYIGLLLLFIVAFSAGGYAQDGKTALVDFYLNKGPTGEINKTTSSKLKTIVALKKGPQKLVQALQSIARQAGLKLSYSKQVIPFAKKITIKKEKLTAEQALWDVLEGTGYRFGISVSGQLVLVRMQQPSSESQQETITGTVTDGQSGETLPGVNILVKGTSTGTSTDSEGKYELTVESLQDTLVFSFVGYQTQQVPINGRTAINVSLKIQAISGQEMVVIGYGKTSQKELTGSVANVQGNDLVDIPSANVGQVLEGRLTGVQVTRVNGAPGAGSRIRIRGTNSINGNSDPLYVIDGFIVGKNFDLNKLDVNNIESINVLKDATATGIYGTRGANGVVLVTTKDGTGLKAGKPEVAINASVGVQSVQNKFNFLNGRQQAEYANDAAKVRSAAIPFPDLSKVPNTNWLDVISRKAPIAKGNVAVSGVSSDRNLNYYISGSYFNQIGIIKSSEIHKYHFRANTDIKLSKYFKTGIRFSVGRNFQKNNKVNFGNIFLRILPNRAIYNKDGEFTALNPVSGTVRTNPAADIKLRVNNNYVTDILGNAYLQYEPTKNLTLKTEIGPELNYYKLNVYNPGTLPQNRIISQGGDGNVQTSNYTNLLNTNTIEYDSDLNTDQHIDILGGFTWQTHQLEGVNARAYGFSNDITEYNNLGNGSDPTRNIVGSNYGSYQLVSWFGRAHYSFQDKYLLTLVGRVDGSSRFSTSENQYGFFPSGAFAWRLSDEPFIKKLNIFSDLKLKVSYGLSGSQAIGSYRTLPILNGVSSLFDEQKYSGVIYGRPANPNLTWEKTKQLNIGLNAGFFRGRLNINAEYYRKKTKDLLLNVKIPDQTGFSSKLQNLGAVENQGLEFEVTSNNISHRNFQWSTRLTLSGNRNKVLNLGTSNYINVVGPSARGSAQPGGRLIVGKPAPVFYGVKYLGTWKSQKQINASSQTGTRFSKLGGPHFQDTNGDGQITIADYHVIGGPQPDFYGGLQNTLSYRNISLSIFLQGSYGNQIFNSLTQNAFFGREEKNKYAEVVNRWTPNNRDSNIPRAGTVTSKTVPNNTEEIEDASYLRLKNIQLTYNLPLKKMGLTKISGLSVYFSGTNLLLFSPFQLFDPEVSRYGSSNVKQGFSEGEYPYAKILTFGIKATL